MGAGPCTTWSTVADCIADPSVPGAENVDVTVLETMLEVASELLWVWSGRQYSGVCVDTVRPCRQAAWVPPVAWWRWDPTWGRCSCTSYATCGCGQLAQISLGAYPIREITEVRINGAALDPSTYRVDDMRWLVRLDGGWPACQDLTADPATDPNTFQVSFRWGAAPPTSGVLAARVFATELAKAALQHEDCRLPERVQSIARNGITFGAILDPMEFLDKGRTGIFVVDAFLAAANPNGLARRPTVHSPDRPRPVRRTNVVPGS